MVEVDVEEEVDGLCPSDVFVYLRVPGVPQDEKQGVIIANGKIPTFPHLVDDFVWSSTSNNVFLSRGMCVRREHKQKEVGK